MLASVIICTYNPRRHYLRRVLDALRSQTLLCDEWELLLIDNGSDEPLTAGNCDLSWHPRARHVREERPGIAFAKLRGMQEAAAEILIFVDDDNLLAPDYLTQVLRIGREFPMLGVWGSGSISPEFEVQPAEELVEYLGRLALRDVKMPLWTNVFTVAEMPRGAGQCLRSCIGRRYGEQFEKSIVKINSRNSRDSHTFHGGVDVEIGYVACASGFGVGIFPELKLVHLISKERVNEDYVVRLLAGIAVSGTLLEYKWGAGVVPRSPFAGALGVPRVIRNVLRRKGIQRRLYLANVWSKHRARTIILEQTRQRVKGDAHPSH
jgi:glycosyltransferase involved in cell wall biosynthesis